MSLSFDFAAPDQTIVVLGVPASSTAAITTLLLQTAPFALSSGRVLRVEFETIGVDSAGGALFHSLLLVIAGGSPPSIATLTSSATLTRSNSPFIFPSGIGYAINGSGDLDVIWNNQDTSKTHDISCHIRQRIVGS